MVNNSFHDKSKNNFGRLSFSGKYIAKIFILKKFLVSECIFKLVCFCESCRESEIYFTQVDSMINLRADCFWYSLASFFNYNAWKRCNYRGVFGTLSKIYNGAFLRKKVNDF